MTFSTDVFPSLVDWSNMADPDGTIADIAWILSQCNDIVKDIIWHQANAPLYHKITVNSALPIATWRGNNQGVPSSKPLNAQVSFTMGMMAAYSKVDKAEADLYGEIGKFRWNQDQPHIQGMSQQAASAFFYSNEAVNPNQFTGLSIYYSSLVTATAQTAKNVLSAGGSGNNNSSIWLCSHGDESLFGIFPKGSQAGLVYQDKGDLRGLYDANGNEFEGYTSYFEWKLGLAVKDWRYTVRVCNIDTTTSGLFGTAPPDLNGLLVQAANKLPTSTRRMSNITSSDAPGDPVPGTNPCFYSNRTVKTGMELQAIRDKNVLISLKEYAGQPVEMWRDVPWRVCDALLTTESTVS